MDPTIGAQNSINFTILKYIYIYRPASKEKDNQRQQDTDRQTDPLIQHGGNEGSQERYAVETGIFL